MSRCRVFFSLVVVAERAPLNFNNQQGWLHVAFLVWVLVFVAVVCESLLQSDAFGCLGLCWVAGWLRRLLQAQEHLAYNRWRSFAVQTVRNNKTLPPTQKRVISMTEDEIEEMQKKHRFRPPMDDADSPAHDEHIKRLREQQKSQTPQNP